MEQATPYTESWEPDAMNNPGSIPPKVTDRADSLDKRLSPAKSKWEVQYSTGEDSPREIVTDLHADSVKFADGCMFFLDDDEGPLLILRQDLFISAERLSGE